jgi:AraC family transcriptional regulator
MSRTSPGPAADAAGAPPRPPCRDRTAASHRRSVESAIAVMREHLGEPLSLDAIARSGASSRYHFDRIFHQVTGVPPFRFLAALRMDAARRLLLTTGYSATSICFEVGYSSVGSFTRQFGVSVGLSPQRLRSFAAAGTGEASLSRAAEVEDGLPVARSGVAGRVEVPAEFSGVVFVGLFPTALPDGRPSACVLLHEAGPFRASPVADGTYHVFAAGIPLPLRGNAADALLHQDVLRGSAGPVTVRGGHADGAVGIVLRPRAEIDPPILVSLPVLLTERLAAGASSRERAAPAAAGGTGGG